LASDEDLPESRLRHTAAVEVEKILAGEMS
jgi:hypothetical protein